MRAIARLASLLVAPRLRRTRGLGPSTDNDGLPARRSAARGAPPTPGGGCVRFEGDGRPASSRGTREEAWEGTARGCSTLATPVRAGRRVTSERKNRLRLNERPRRRGVGVRRAVEHAVEPERDRQLRAADRGVEKPDDPPVHRGARGRRRRRCRSPEGHPLGGVRPETVPGFSAVGYDFGRHLQKARERAGRPDQQHRRRHRGRAPGRARRSSTPIPSSREAAQRLRTCTTRMIAPLVPSRSRASSGIRASRTPAAPTQYRTLFSGDDQELARRLEAGRLPVPVRAARPVQKTAEPTGHGWAELREAQLHDTQTVAEHGDGRHHRRRPREGHPPAATRSRSAPAWRWRRRRLAYGEKIEYSRPALREDEGRGRQGGPELHARRRRPGGEGRRADGLHDRGRGRQVRPQPRRPIIKDTVVVRSEEVASADGGPLRLGDYPEVNLGTGTACRPRRSAPTCPPRRRERACGGR